MYNQSTCKEKSSQAQKRNELETIGWIGMAYGRRVEFEAVREVAFGGIGAAYAALGAALTDNARIIGITNTTDAEVYISFDGVTNHLRVAPGSFKLYDLTANKVRDDGYFLGIGTQVFQVRVAGAPTVGALWVEVMIAGGGV